MINMKNQKVNEVKKGLHEALVKACKGGLRYKEDILMGNRLFMVVCKDISLAPPQISEELNRIYGYQTEAADVLAHLRARRMAKPTDRHELLSWAENVADHFAAAVEGSREHFEAFEKLRKEPALQFGKKHKDQERLAALMIYARYPELAMDGDLEMLQSLGNVLGRYFFYDMADAVAHVYGFPCYSDKKKAGQKPSRNEDGNMERDEEGSEECGYECDHDCSHECSHEKEEEEEKQLTYEEAIRRVNMLENSLDRTNIMLRDLQEEFEEQLAEAKVKELTDFFALLNSEKYGYLLDELLIVRKGVDELRKKNYQLPIEINGLLIMVKKMIQFVRDSHIEPIMKPGTVREVTAADIEFCSYEGTPFEDSNETKLVKVISPGWVYKDKEVQISRPKIREEM